MNTANDLSSEKKGLRTVAQARRKLASAKFKDGAAGRELSTWGLSFLKPAPARGTAVSAYLAMRDELDCGPLIERLSLEGLVTALPVIERKASPLRFRRWAPGDPTAPAGFGTREPLASAPLIEPDILLVPLLAFDRRGNRLGYGGGFYDRTIARLRAAGTVTAIGIAFAEQEMDAVPADEKDAPLDWVLTPAGPIACRASHADGRAASATTVSPGAF